MLAEALLGVLPVPYVADAYTAIRLLQAWSKRPPEYALTSDGPGIYLKTGEVSKETRDKYIGAHSIFTDDRRLDIHNVLWDKLSDDMYTEQLRYWFTLVPEKSGKVPLYIRVVLPFYWNRLDTTLAKEYYIEIEWQAEVTEEEQKAVTKPILDSSVVSGQTGPLKGCVVICEGPGVHRNPDVYQNTIVWSGKREEDTDFNIYAWDPENGIRAICSAPRDQTYPAIYGNTIVWRDERDYGMSGSDIYAWDPVNGERRLSSMKASPSGAPHIHGRTAVSFQYEGASFEKSKIYASFGLEPHDDSQ